MLCRLLAETRLMAVIISSTPEPPRKASTVIPKTFIINDPAKKMDSVTPIAPNVMRVANLRRIAPSMPSVSVMNVPRTKNGVNRKNNFR